MDFSKIRDLPFFPSAHRVQVVMDSLRERLRGLDFTMPDAMHDRQRHDGAMYHVTPDEVLKGVFSHVDLKKHGSFLDIGCGKGYVLWKAEEYGFQKVGGVEYDEKLVKICRRNLLRLKLDGEVSVTCGDACSFARYGDYDVFYFFNPFMSDMMTKVIDRIIESCRGKEIMLLYYRPRYTAHIEGCGYFTKVCSYESGVKGYDVNIYQGRIPLLEKKTAWAETPERPENNN